MFNYLYALLTAALVTAFAIPSIIKVAKVKHLFDVPDARKVHKESIPTLGGMAIFAGMLFSVTFWTNQVEIVELQYIIASLLILFFIGIKDDLVNLRASKKLLGQVFAAIILVHFAQIKLTTFFGLFGVRDLPVWFSYFFSIFTCVVITNAFNLIDGIDGLAGSLGIVGATTFGMWYYFLGMTQYTILCSALIGALLAFLWFNKTPAKIFMGDTGSMMVGFIMALLAMKFIESVRVLPRDHAYKILSIPVFTCTVLLIPLFDTLRVFIIRMSKGKSPFSPDRNHIHHILIDLGLTHLEATFGLVLFNVCMIFMVFFLQGLEGEFLLAIVILIPTLLTAFLSRLKNNYVLKKVKVLIDATSLTNDMTGVTRYGVEILKYFKQANDLEFSFIITPNLKEDHELFALFPKATTVYHSLVVSGIGPMRELKLLKFRLFTRPMFDVFHCFTTNAPFAFPGRSVVTMHDLKYIRYPEYFGSLPKLKSLFLKIQIGFAIKFYSKLACISQSTLNDLMDAFPEKKKTIEAKALVIHNGLTPLSYDPTFISKRNLPERYFLYLGELRPHKNIQNIISAFKQFKSATSEDVSLVIAGKKHPSFAVDMTGDSICYLGPVNDDELPGLYKNSMALIFPTLYEGFGLPILEAMDLGVPVITSTISSMPEVAGEAGILVNPHSVDEIAKGMGQIAQNENLRKGLIAKGLVQSKKFSWKTAAQSLLNIYRNIK